MAARPRIVRTVKALRGAIAALRGKKRKVALVPTMGALHDGHISLVRFAHENADRVVASIFVNPAQFGPQEDFGRYPRTWKADIRKLSKEKTDLVFAPSVEDIYPEGFATRIMPEGPARAGLEDRFRPHFFSGVATVVAKLLIEAMPDIAIFGEIGLSGEIRRVTQSESRLREAAKLGFRRALAPQSVKGGRKAPKIEGLEVLEVGHLQDMIDWLYNESRSNSVPKRPGVVQG